MGVASGRQGGEAPVKSNIDRGGSASKNRRKDRVPNVKSTREKENN
jgi:hypothetical protein